MAALENIRFDLAVAPCIKKPLVPSPLLDEEPKPPPRSAQNALYAQGAR